MTVVGIVDANGEIWSRFTRGDHVARGQGRLAGTKGKGTWSSGSAYCGGRWQAEKLK